MNEWVRYMVLIIFVVVMASCGGEDAANKETKHEELTELLLECSDDEGREGSLKSNEQMDNAHMNDILQRIDPELQGQLGSWLLQYETFKVQVITDENADRMRVIVPIIKVADIEKEELIRLMQANFDSALDARYSVANGVVWSAFIHPLSTLSDEEFVSGFAQAVTAASTFGSTYSSGALIFRGGDSGEQQREYYESILEKGLSI